MSANGEDWGNFLTLVLAFFMNEDIPLWVRIAISVICVCGCCYGCWKSYCEDCCEIDTPITHRKSSKSLLDMDRVKCPSNHSLKKKYIF